MRSASARRTSAGWGFHVDTTRRVWFDVGASAPDRLWIEAETGDDGRLEVLGRTDEVVPMDGGP